MKKAKILAAVAAAAVLSVSGGLLAGCNSKHTHTYSEDWKSDANGHWHVATCDDLKEGDKDYQKDYAEHEWGDDNECDVCKYEKTPDAPVDTVYTVTLNVGEGTLPAGTAATLETVNGKLSSLPTPTAPDGHWFTGWYTAATEGTKIDKDYVFSGETTEVDIYAQYAEEVTVRLEIGDGSVEAGTPLEYTTVNGKLPITLPEPTTAKENWKFGDWYDAEEGGNAIVEATTVFTAETTIYARYVRKDGIWLDETMAHALTLNTGCEDHTQYWFGDGVRVELEEGDEVSIYMGGKLISFWISGSCVDKSKEGVEKVSSATVTKDASFVIYLNDYSSPSNPDNWTCEFLGVAEVTDTTNELPEGCKGIQISVGDGNITLYLVGPDDEPINGTNAHKYQIYAWDGVATTEGGSTDPFGAWATNPTLNKSITAQCGIVKTTSWKLHWSGGESNAFAGLVVGNAYIVKVKTGSADCEAIKYIGEVNEDNILEPYTPETPDVDPSKDTREFFMRGSGKSDKLDGWNASAKTKFTKDDDKNEYTITLDLYVGDSFKIGTSDWSSEFAIGNIEKEFEGVACFGGTGNIECIKDGNYTFTITTKQGDGIPDTVTWVRNGDATVIEDTTTHYYIKGDAVTGGWNVPASDTTELKETGAGTGVYTMTIELAAGKEFMFYSTEVGNETGKVNPGNKEIKGNKLEAGVTCVTGTGNMTTTQAGYYTFTYTASTDTLKVTYSETKPTTPAPTAPDGEE